MVSFFNFETCNACGDRWYLDVRYRTYDCIQCQYGCKRCDDSEICKVADCGFYILPDGRVNRCNKACSTCDADQVCNTLFLDTFSTTVQVITVFAGIVSLIVLDAQDLLNVSFVDAGTI